MISFPLPPKEYNSQYQAELTDNLRELEQTCVNVNEDNYLETGSIILKDTSNNNHYKLQVTGGSLTVALVTTEQSTNPYA